MSKDLDSLMKELVEERICEMPHPPKEEVWEQLTVRLRKKRREERRINAFKRLKPVLAACMVIIFLAVLYVNPKTQVAAITDKMIKRIVEITQDTVKVYKKVDSTAAEKTDYLFGRDIEDPRIGEAQKKVHFRLFIPEYIPEGFELDSVDILNKNEKKETVTFLYVNSNSSKKDCFEIIQRSYSEDTSVTMNINKGANTKIENLTLDGIEYTLINHEKDLNGLLWDTDNIGCEISGNISRDDIIEIAKSMK
jgi:hypothetical protein